ncbi:hypothetical protein IEQ44_00525 [Nocardioides sp. Y6]|uniref:DUF4352 domain-containing protein n=1 Tax=Nocardioides malaquae TaxID=2773426 RepID=A0ABR9RNJ1_9ACTN|nr:hypothetical protein [Nocardioides malaquae]MBE7323134.1 hypothetical protein [Nocardioides malaquae]
MTGAHDEDARQGAAQGEAVTVTPAGGRLRLLRTLTLRQTLITLATLVVLVSGAFGGLATAQDDDTALPEVEPGEVFDAAPLEITVERARWVTDLGDTIEAPTGRYVAVMATLTNTSDHMVGRQTLRSAVALTDLVGAVGDDGTPAERSVDVLPTIYVLDDATELTQAPPGLTYAVAFVWDQDDAVAPPDSVSFELRGHTWRAHSVDQVEDFADMTAVGSGQLEVEPDPQLEEGS